MSRFLEGKEIKTNMYLVHVGINAESKAEAQAIAALFQSVLELEKYENDEQIFMDSCIEIMKTPGLGKKGHLAFKTENLEAAVSKMQKKGIKFAEENFKYDGNGKLCAAYLKNEIAGFAVHLM